MRVRVLSPYAVTLSPALWLALSLTPIRRCSNARSSVPGLTAVVTRDVGTKQFVTTKALRTVTSSRFTCSIAGPVTGKDLEAT
jgi:hypothetical protein